MIRWRRVIGIPVITLISVVIGLEVLLRVIDPLGGYARLIGIRAISTLIEDDPIGLTYRAGHIHAPDYSVTMLSDHSRLVQDSNWQSDCQIAFIGDSFTFGLGVNDEDTFVNYLAQSLALNARNYGINGYNTQQVLIMRNRIQADGYVYLHIDNDWHRRAVFDEGTVREQLQQPVFALSPYLRSRPVGEPTLADDNGIYRVSLATLATDPQVLTFAFDTDIGTRAHEWHKSIILLDDALYIEHQTSYLDAHPNKTGHHLIAGVMQPHLETFVNRICEDE